MGCGNGLGVIHRTVGFLFTCKWSHGGLNEEVRTFNISFSRNLSTCEEFSGPNATEGWPGNSGESVSYYVATLKHLAAECKFGEAMRTERLRDRLLSSIRDSKMITEILKVKLADLSFDLAAQKCLEIVQAFFWLLLKIHLHLQLHFGHCFVAGYFFPRLTTQWGGAVFSISDERLERVGLLVDDNESELIGHLHTETDLGEGCGPVGRKLCLCWLC